MDTFATRALVVEGGGLRGVFASGVLDAFLDARFDPFGLYIGTSAGALNLSSHLAGQRGRNYSLYTHYATDPNFISVQKFLRGGHLMDLDWFWRASLSGLPFNLDAALTHLENKTFLITTTSLTTGEALFINPERDTWLSALKASSAVPFMYRHQPQVWHGGQTHATTDGGVAAPLPVMEAVKRGATHVLVIRSRPLSCVKGSRVEPQLVRLALRKYPHGRRLALAQNQIYGDALAYIANPPAGVTVQQIAPADNLQTKRAVPKRGTLDTDYRHGYTLAQRFLEEQGGKWQTTREPAPTAGTIR